MKGRRGLGLILAAALVLRVVFVLARQGRAASEDEYHWDHLAQVFAQEGIAHPDAGTYRPPLYALMLAAFYRVGGHCPGAVRLWQALLGTATCALLYAIGRRLGGERVALSAAALSAFYPLFVFFAGVLMAETLLVFLSTAVLWLALRAEEAPAPGRFALWGFVLGLAALCKPVLLPWAPLLWWGWWRRCTLEPRLRRRYLLLAAGALVATVAPWTLRNAVATGGYLVPISSNAGINLLIGNEAGAGGAYRDEVDYLAIYHSLAPPQMSPVLQDRAVTRAVLGWIAAAPGRFARLALRKVLLLWDPLVPGESAGRQLVALLSSGPVLALGLWGTWRRWRRPEGWAVASLVLVLTLVHALFFAHTRFRLPADAALMGPAAQVLVGLCTRRRVQRKAT